MAAGSVALLLAVFVAVVAGASPLCEGQNNGDGNNSFRMCMEYVLFDAIFFGIPYMLLLAASGAIGNWVIKIIPFIKTSLFISVHLR